MADQPRYRSSSQEMGRTGGGGRGRGPGPGRKLEKPKNAKKTIARLLKYIGTQKIAIILAFVMVALATVASLAASTRLQPIIDTYLKETAEGLSIDQRVAGLFKNVLVLAGIYAIFIIFNYAQQRIMVYAAQQVIRDIRNDMFDHMETLPLKYLDTHTRGQIMSRYTNDVDTLQNVVQQSVITLFSSALTIVGTIAVMLARSVVLTLIVLAAIPGIMALAVQIAKKSSKYFVAQQRDLGEADGYIEEMVTGQKVVKVFNYENRAVKEFTKLNENLRHSATTAMIYGGIMMPLTRNINNMVYALVAAIGGVLTVKGYISVGALVVFLQLTRRFGMPINEVSNQYNTVITAIAGAERIFAIIDEKPEDIGNEGKWKLSQEGDSFYWEKDGEKVPVAGDVRFNDVTFGYRPEKDILKNISLYAKPGHKIAFVGSTGAGKTTVTNLITRFYDIEKGSITVDGINIKDIGLKDLRASLSMVLQDTHLFTGTIRDNIRYGRPSATDEEIMEAAKLTLAHNFIIRLPDGYDTVIDGDGANLSQGQRQLLNITRAAVAKAPILILDEATSSIDTRTEKMIEQGLDRLMSSRTTFIIAHRLSTVRNANAIMVIEKGNIIERGTHEQLVAAGGRYWQLYTGQIELD